MLSGVLRTVERLGLELVAVRLFVEGERSWRFPAADARTRAEGSKSITEPHLGLRITRAG